MSFLNKYKRWKPQMFVTTDKYMDFVLSLESLSNKDFNTDFQHPCLSSYIDTLIPECFEKDGVCSTGEHIWSGATTEPVTLENIGFNGIDNGLIKFDRDRVSNSQLFDIITNSKLFIDDQKLHLIYVSGNTKTSSFDLDKVSDEKDTYLALKGGFMQGFFKDSNCQYQVLPYEVEDTWNIEVTLRPRHYETKDNILNTKYPDNSGIFFYMGTRAENKFMLHNGYDLSKFEDRDEDTEPCAGIDLMNYFGKQLGETENADTAIECYNKQYGDIEHTNVKKSDLDIIVEDFDDYNNDNYYADDYEKEDACDIYNNDDYSIPDIEINDEDVKDNTEHSVLENTNNTFRIVTDNKFLTYDRTTEGFTVDNHPDDAFVEFTLPKDTSGINLFLYANRTPTGYTTETIEELQIDPKTQKLKNVSDDITENAFALKYNDDGSIGYRYLVKDCDSDNRFKIVEEKSYPGMVDFDKWSTVNLKVKKTATDRMKLYIYIDGRLKLVSRELPMFRFRSLDDYSEKQEGVPFSISVGGGTLGLGEAMWTRHGKVSKKILPLERHFAGTFIGDIHAFKFYGCPIDYNTVKNNYRYELNIK